MMTCIVGTACFALGLYAGKRRAKGRSWKMIAEDLWKGFVYPFRADREEACTKSGDDV